MVRGLLRRTISLCLRKLLCIVPEANWPEPWKYIQFPEVGLSIDTASDGETLTLSCKRPIKGVILDVDDRRSDAESGEVRWSDQAIDMMPGDDQIVVAKGLKGRKVKARVSYWAFPGNENRH